MGRPTKPWSISATRANGVYWYYRLDGWANYQSTGIQVERRGGRPTTRSRQQAEEYASRMWHSSALVAARGETVAQVLADAYRWEGDRPECPYIRQILTDGGGTGYTRETARQNRGRIERYVIADPIGTEPSTAPPARWQEWKQRMVERGQNPGDDERGFGPRTVNMTLDHVRAYFQWLVDTGRMSHNPLASVRAIRDDSDGRGIFTADELRAMFANSEWWGYPGRPKQQREQGPIAYACAVLVASTLCRPFEVFGIRWRDVDMDAGALTIPKQKRVRGKGDKGRTVPLTAMTRDALFALDRGGPDDLVFGDRSRHFYDQRFAAMMRASGFPATDPDGRQRTPYSLKHSMYTLLIDEGADPVTVAELAGHSRRAIGARSLTRTQEHYKRATLERLQKIAPLVDQVMGYPPANGAKNVITFPAG